MPTNWSHILWGTLLVKFAKFNLIINQTNQMSIRMRLEVVGTLDCNNQELDKILEVRWTNGYWGEGSEQQTGNGGKGNFFTLNSLNLCLSKNLKKTIHDFSVKNDELQKWFEDFWYKHIRTKNCEKKRSLREGSKQQSGNGGKDS